MTVTLAKTGTGKLTLGQVHASNDNQTGWADNPISAASASFGADTDTVKVSIPKDEADDGRRLFGRLRVTK